MLCMTKPQVFNCIYHDGDASAVYEFIKEHVKYQSVQIPMGRNPFPVIELCYLAEVPKDVLQASWQAFSESERLSSQYYGYHPSIHVPPSHTDQTVYISPTQWLLVLNGEPLVVSAEEFKEKYCECKVQ